MGYDESYEERGSMARQKDLVLKTNEFAHILSKTDGNIKCAVGPYQTSLSQQEVPVIFNTKTKRFDECDDYSKAKQLFISAPEGWYIILKNPSSDGLHPEVGRPNQTPKDMKIGKKVNIFGPTTFALFPGQMAKVISGHRLRSNQYLLARVYDADAANENTGIIKTVNDETKETTTESKYFNGQLLIIKGTEVAFYIPPTGIEVIPVGGTGNNYVRDAITLERLEYCILKNENGEKRYVYGPDVVFPEPTETFVKSEGTCSFKAIELSNISGIYAKVIAEYTDDYGTFHPVGEELFITGKEQMIYYPRPEHSIISYEGKYMHHAIAIPAGEGRYIMDRETGEIKTVIGPTMYLPDPRHEVVVKRKLTPKQCQLWYPGNDEVRRYNEEMSSTKKSESVISAMDGISKAIKDVDGCTKIMRSNTFSEPRSITLDNKYSGAVTIDVWTGYAVNVVSKTGSRDIVVGPKTIILNYDESLEAMELSTGKPKTTDHLMQTVYLRIENNKISDIINATTKDFINVDIKVSYCVNFLANYQDKWFSVENYVKYLCDYMRSIIKKTVKHYSIEEFFNNYVDIIREATLGGLENSTHVFEENGMELYETECLSIHVESGIEELLLKNQYNVIQQGIELSNTKKIFENNQELTEYKKMTIALNKEVDDLQQQVDYEKRKNKINYETQLQQLNQDYEQKCAELNLKIQETQNLVNAEKRKNRIEDQQVELDHKTVEHQIEATANEAKAKNIQNIISSFSPDLIAALNSKANAELAKAVVSSLSPYALASSDESVADVVKKLCGGTPIEDIIATLCPQNNLDVIE